MKPHFIILFLLTLLMTTGCHQAKKPDSELQVTVDGSDIKDTKNDEGKTSFSLLNRFPDTDIVIPLTRELDSKDNTFLINNLALLGKIWGLLKYHHPEVGKGKYDWDNELFRFLPEYLNINEIVQRDEMLLQWIEKYGDILPCITCQETAPDAFLKPDFSWVENGTMSAALKEKIMEIYRNRLQEEHYYIKIANDPFYYNFNENLNLYSSYPDASFRLLALYRYWNIIQYFFPYKYLTDKSWNEVIIEYIPLFILAETALEYQLAILQLTGEINDTHARVVQGFNKVDSLRGNMQAPFRVQFIENKLVVTDFYKPELKESTVLKTGDIITRVNGKTIEYIIDSIKPYYPASNESVRMSNLINDLVRSSNKTILIDYEDSGTVKQTELNLYPRMGLNMYRSNKPGYELLRDNMLMMKDLTGYFVLGSMNEKSIDEFKKSFENTKGILIDIRKYPAMDGLFLASYFVSKDTPFAKMTRANLNNPGEIIFDSIPQIIPKPEEGPYTGKIVVIVNEESMSHAEYISMAFRAGDNTVIIGSQTAGADGNVSYILLPDNLKTAMSSVGVYYPDGQETQRTGIVPDLEVKPTIQGIREGRDELLEKAIEIIKNDSIWNEIKRNGISR